MTLELLHTQISIYSSVHDTVGSAFSFGDLVNNIKNGAYTEQIHELRNETEEIKKRSKKLTLPAVTISGLFGNRRRENNLLRHSGLIQVDIDKISEPYKLKSELINDPYVLVLFISPSGNGLKIIARIPPIVEKHRHIFNLLEKYFLLKYKLKIDQSCKDVSRLMFVSDDPQLYLNPAAKIFTDEVLSSAEVLFAIAIQKTNNKMRFLEGRNNYVLSMSAVCRNRGLTQDYCAKFSVAYFEESGFDAAEIQKCVNQAYKYGNHVPLQQTNKPQLLRIRTAKQCVEDAKSKPIPETLFAEFWLENEIAILFADTNAGKSVLAVQIANSISTGMSIPGFCLSAKKQKVFYFDFELSDKQFEKRYSDDYKDHYLFDDNFHRVEINPDFTNYDDFETSLYQNLEDSILKYGVRILIIDNITFLRAQSTETARDALPLMKKLVDLKKKYDLSILILAHTPKRKATNPITINDLAGSKQIANFADSIFSIGVCHRESGHCYLKQLKARSTEKIYDAENVIVCRIEKERNFLQFNFIKFDDEKNHLKQLTQSEQDELDLKILELKKSQPHLSLGQIASVLGTNKMKVKRVLDRMVNRNTRNSVTSVTLLR